MPLDEHSVQAVQASRWFQSPWMVLVTVLLGTSMPLADTTSMNVGRFFITRALDSDPNEARWLGGGYSLFVAIGIPLSHRLLSFFPPRTLYTLATLAFMTGSVISMNAHFMPGMMLGRSLQGIAGGILLPLSVTLLTASFPEEKRATGLLLFSLGNALAVSLGPTLGGDLVDFAGWRWTMGIHLPLGFATLLLVQLTLEDHTIEDLRRFDMPGWLLFGVSSFFLVYALMEGERFGWHSHFIFMNFLLFLVMFFSYFLWAALFSDPIFPLELFSYPGFVLLSAINLFRSISVFGRLYLLPLFLEDFYHFQAHQAGHLIMTGALVELLIPVLGTLVSTHGKLPWLTISVGTFFLGLANVAYVKLPVDAYPFFEVLLPNLVFGIGMAMVQVSITPLVQSTLPSRLFRNGNVTQLTIMFLGGTLGTVLARHFLNDLVPVFLTQRSFSPLTGRGTGGQATIEYLSREYSYNMDFWIMGIIALLASALAFWGLLLHVGPRLLPPPVEAPGTTRSKHSPAD